MLTYKGICGKCARATDLLYVPVDQANQLRAEIFRQEVRIRELETRHPASLGPCIVYSDKTGKTVAISYGTIPTKEQP